MSCDPIRGRVLAPSYPLSPSWPSPSRDSRIRARTSAARSTRSPRPACATARAATRRACRTAAAPPAAPTRAARWSCSSRTSKTTSNVIAVDANGADQGPGAVAEGVRRAGLRLLLFGPRAELAGAGPHAEVVDAPESIKGGDEPVAAVRSRREASIVRAAQAVADGEA